MELLKWRLVRSDGQQVRPLDALRHGQLAGLSRRSDGYCVYKVGITASERGCGTRISALNDTSGPEVSVMTRTTEHTASAREPRPLVDERRPAQRVPVSGVAVLPGPTVLLADPSRARRDLLSTDLFGAGFGRVLEANSVRALDTVIDSTPAGDLALVSADFGAELIAAIQSLRWARWPWVIVLAHGAGIEAVIDAVNAGAGGVLRGPSPAKAPAPVQVPSMSGREIQIIEGVADGQSNQRIARALGVSPLTVKSHLARIGRKLGSGERAAMVATAMRAGIIQ